MKNTIITLASVLAITGSANAQVYDNVSYTPFASAGGNVWNSNLTIGGVSVGTLTATLNGFSGFTTAEAIVSSIPGVNMRGATSNPPASSASWTFDVAAATGYVSNGISFFNTSSNLGDPIFANFSTDGAGFVTENGFDMFAGLNDGDPVANGSSPAANTLGGVGTSANSSVFRQWSLDSAGASTVSFDYTIGSTITNISNETIRVGVEIAPVPEPSSAALLGLGALGLLARRKRA